MTVLWLYRIVAIVLTDGVVDVPEQWSLDPQCVKDWEGLQESEGGEQGRVWDRHHQVLRATAAGVGGGK